MNANALLALIKQKQAAIVKLQAELDEARELLAPYAPPRVGRRKGVQQGIMPGSSVGRALGVLEEAGVPLHVDEIVVRIMHTCGLAVNRQTLVGNLSRYVKAERVFRRAGLNVFGLLPSGRIDDDARSA